MTSPPATQPGPADRADDIPSSRDERTVLTTFLDYARDTVHAQRRRSLGHQHVQFRRAR